MTRTRRARWGAAGAALATSLGLVVGGAAPASADHLGARVFIDPADPCPVPAPPADFDDRDEIPDVHLPNVDCGFTLQIARGTTGGDFNPASMIRRDQMAAFIARTLRAAGYELPAGPATSFTDVQGNVHQADIRTLAGIGVVQGKTSTTYAPDQFVRRDQMASFLVRAAEYAYGAGQPGNDDLQGAITDFYDVFAQVPFEGFDDVDTGNVHYRSIVAASQLIGVAAGVSEDRYEPAAPVRRDQMGTFVTRLLDSTLTPEQALEYDAASS